MPRVSDATDPLPRLAHRCWKVMEALHAGIYFSPDAAREYEQLGVSGRAGYFASRGAAFGTVPAGVVDATFYVWSPTLVAKLWPRAWEATDPQSMTAARHRGVRAMLEPALADLDLARPLALAQEACAGLTAPGRALYAAHAAQPVPDDDVTALWHAATLLREHRGDGHVAVLLAAGLGPVEAMWLHGAYSGTLDFLRASRGWADEDWAAAADRLRERGLMDAEDGLTDAGSDLKKEVERQTGLRAEEGWRHLGADGCARLDEALAPVKEALVAAEVLPAGLLR